MRRSHLDCQVRSIELNIPGGRAASSLASCPDSLEKGLSFPERLQHVATTDSFLIPGITTMPLSASRCRKLGKGSPYNLHATTT
jgi:hypothetical protein